VSITPPIQLNPHWSGNNNDNLTLTHPNFEPNSTYNVTLADGAEFNNGAAMIGGASWEFRTALRPTVLVKLPLGHNVGLAAPITIDFSEQMAPTSVQVQTIPAMQLTPSWSKNGCILTLQHEKLAENTTYNITIPAAAASLKGATLGADYQWEFKTWLITKVVSFFPVGSDVNPKSNIILDFNKPMNVFSVPNALTIDPPTEGDWAAGSNGTKFIFTPKSMLQPNTDYTVTLHGFANDQNENEIGDDAEWYFTTGTAQATTLAAFPWILLALVLIIALAAGSAGYYSYRRKTRPKPKTGPQPLKRTPPTI